MTITVSRAYNVGGMRTILEASDEMVSRAIEAIEWHAAQIGAQALYLEDTTPAVAGPVVAPTVSAAGGPSVPQPGAPRKRRTNAQIATDEAAKVAGAVPQPTVTNGQLAPPVVQSGAPQPPQPTPQHVGFASGAQPPAPQQHVGFAAASPPPPPPVVQQRQPPAKGPHWDGWYQAVKSQLDAVVGHAPAHMHTQTTAAVNGILAKHGGQLEMMTEAQMSAVYSEVQQQWPPSGPAAY